MEACACLHGRRQVGGLIFTVWCFSGIVVEKVTRDVCAGLERLNVAGFLLHRGLPWGTCRQPLPRDRWDELVVPQPGPQIAAAPWYLSGCGPVWPYDGVAGSYTVGAYQAT